MTQKPSPEAAPTGITPEEKSAGVATFNDKMAAVAAPTKRGRAGSGHLSRYSALYLTLVLIGLFSVLVPETFLTDTTLRSLLNSYSITLIGAIGLMYTLSVACYDLTLGAVIALASVLSAWLTTDGEMGVAQAIVIVLLVGLVIGVVNGFLVVVVGIDSFIATLGMSAVIAAIVFKITGGKFVSGVPSSFKDLAGVGPFGIPKLTIVAVVLVLISWYILEHTPVGRRMFATGADLDAARLAGVPTSRLRFLAFLATAFVSSIAGILLTAQGGSATPALGESFLLPCFAAALFGATQIKPGRVNIGGTVVAIVLLAVGIQGLQLMGAALWITNLFYGAALIVAVAASVLTKKYRLKRYAREEQS